MIVYVVNFEGDLCDCNAVFSSLEKAIDYLNREQIRCSDIWSGFECTYQNDDTGEYLFEFDVKDRILGTQRFSVSITPHIIDDEI